jgi:cytochrome o ubiquinol oxidase operon protein cyoD
MSDLERPKGASLEGDRAPGQHETPSLRGELAGTLWGLLLAIGLTAASFWAVRTPLIYGPGLAVALLVLAVAQMGVHLVFFLHITTSPDNTNNVLALAFGILIVCVLVFGSLWVMGHLNHSMAVPDNGSPMQP